MSNLTDKNRLSIVRPDLAAEWHPTKNGRLSPEDVSYGSKKKIWWICSEGHSFQSKPNSRTSRASNCPYCSGRKVGPDNNLAIRFPMVASQWHPTKNGKLTPKEVAAKSQRKVWWLCPKGHSHLSVVSNRTGNQTGCPYCSGNLLGADNNLAAKFPAIAAEWHPTKNGELKPTDVGYGVANKVWWICPSGHSYDAKINSRTAMRTGCPFCANQRVGYGNDLATVFPDIAAEWHPTKNGKVKPKDVTSGSRKKAWWLCQNGHSFHTTVHNRTGQGTRCPQCTNQSSEPELRILCELRGIFDEVLSRHKIDGVEVDIYIPKYNLAIEYDGKYWHKDKLEQDLRKNARMKAHSVTLIRVREHPLKPLTQDDLILSYERTMPKSHLNSLTEKLLPFLDVKDQSKVKHYQRAKDFQNNSLFVEYTSYFPDPFPEKSLSVTHPEIAAEWDFDKNHPVTPDNISFGSGRKFWWLCPQGHSYKRSVNKRSNGLNCFYCSGRKSLNLDLFHD